jgi:hypothetical protein
VTLAPARAGVNTLAVTLPPAQTTPPAHISVLLQCGCSASEQFVNLHSGAGGQTWSANVRLPRVGLWSGTVRFDGGLAAVPVQLLVGVPQAPGSTPIQVLSVADLSGPDAPACRSHEIGLQMALARINASGGLDGGHKVAGLVLDSGGSAARARGLTAAALARSHPIALAGVCGTGGEAAVEVASRAGVPSLVGDPAVGPTAGQNVFRLAADPYTQGLALGQLILQRVAKTTAPGVHAVRAVIASDLSGARLRAGLLAGMQGSGLRVDAVAPGALAAMPERRLGDFLSRTQSAAVVIDEPAAGGADARAIAAVGRRQGAQLQPAPVLASERVLNENWILSAGPLGRIGALQGVSDVSPSTSDGTLYQRAVQLLYRGEIASLDGLRGYVTGLALIDAVRRGIGASQIDAALRRPDVFTSALLAPWSAASPGVGSPAVVALQPGFLSTTLVPAQLGGESQDTTYFPSGSWTVTSATPFGEKIGTTPPPLAP